MKNIKLLVISLIITMLLAGCDTMKETEILNYSDEQIVFINQYSNWAEGYNYLATYVTANGNEYEFSYLGDHNSKTYELEDILTFPKDEVIRTISSEEMKKLLESFEKVGNIQFTKKSFACDYGQYSVYGVKYDEQNNAEFVYLGSFGDNHDIPNDKNAKKICKFFGVVWDN